MERFRARQEATPIAPVGQITVSLGVVHWSPRGGRSVQDVLKRADALLFFSEVTTKRISSPIVLASMRATTRRSVPPQLFAA